MIQFAQNSPTFSSAFHQYHGFNAFWVLWIHSAFSVALSLPVPWKMKGDSGGIECIKQLNKGCHKGPDSTAWGRGTRMQSPSPFVLYRPAPKLFQSSSPFLYRQILHLLLHGMLIFSASFTITERTCWALRDAKHILNQSHKLNKPSFPVNKNGSIRELESCVQCGSSFWERCLFIFYFCQELNKKIHIALMSIQ